MEYVDEAVIGLRNDKTGKQHTSTVDITGQYTVYGETYTFSQQQLFDGKLNITLPSGFEPITEHIAEKKYLYAQKPEVTFTGASGRVDLSLNLLKTAVRSEQLPTYLQKVKYMLRRTNPSILFFEIEQIKAVNSVALAMDFKSFSVGGPVYNLMFVTLLDGRLLLGSFNCPFDLWEEWRPVMLAIIETIGEGHTNPLLKASHPFRENPLKASDPFRANPNRGFPGGFGRG